MRNNSLLQDTNHKLIFHKQLMLQPIDASAYFITT